MRNSIKYGNREEIFGYAVIDLEKKILTYDGTLDKNIVATLKNDDIYMPRDRDMEKECKFIFSYKGYNYELLGSRLAAVTAVHNGAYVLDSTRTFVRKPYIICTTVQMIHVKKAAINSSYEQAALGLLVDYAVPSLEPRVAGLLVMKGFLAPQWELEDYLQPNVGRAWIYSGNVIMRNMPDKLDKWRPRSLNQARTVQQVVAWFGWEDPALIQHVKIQLGGAWRCAVARVGIRGLHLLNTLIQGFDADSASRWYMWYAVCPQADIILQWLWDHHFWSFDAGRCRDKLKVLHDMVRSSDLVPDVRVPNVDQWLYMNQLFGRSSRIPSTLDADIEKRRQALREQGLGLDIQPDICTLLNKIFDYAIPMHWDHLYNSVEDWFEDVINYGSSGSSTDLRGENKLSMLCQSSIKQLRRLVEQVGLRGKAFYKLEAGLKNRLLLPGNDANWLRWVLVLKDVERRIYRALQGCPMGWGDAEQYVANQYLVAISGDGWKYASDYSDYNSLHSKETMKMVLTCLISRLLDTCVCDEIREYIRKIGVTLLNDLETLSVDLNGATVKLDHGLWSGWRSTTFINTVLNPVYDRIVAQRCDLLDGTQLEAFLGDDSFGTARSGEDAVALVESLDKVGFDAQVHKQLVSRRRFEFLRVMYRDGCSSAQSLCRAVGNGVSGDLQSGRKDLVYSSQALGEMLSMWRQRGATITHAQAQILESEAIHRLRKYSDRRIRGQVGSLLRRIVSRQIRDGSTARRIENEIVRASQSLLVREDDWKSENVVERLLKQQQQERDSVNLLEDATDENIKMLLGKKHVMATLPARYGVLAASATFREWAKKNVPLESLLPICIRSDMARAWIQQADRQEVVNAIFKMQ